jgi:hypothetical protein
MDSEVKAEGYTFKVLANEGYHILNLEVKRMK